MTFQKQDPLAIPPEVPLLEVEDLVVELGRPPARVLDGLCLRLGQGERLGLLGESGSGKSSAALAILGLLPPSGRVRGGKIRFCGEDLQGAPEDRLRQVRGRGVALIFQDPLSTLNPVITVGEQVAEAFRLPPGRGRRREARRCAGDLLARLDIPSPERCLSAYPHQLSGGMRQRVLLALALACEPRVIIADEPTSALDATLQVQVMALLLAELRRRPATGLLLITHDVGLAARTCDHLVVLQAGRVVERGPARTLVEAPTHPCTAALVQAARGLARGRCHG